MRNVVIYKTLAVLMTCHNRRETTLKCLKALFACEVPQDVVMSVFLVDDGSVDGTAKAIKEHFSNVQIIQGTGDLYWNQGMRLAWNTASLTNDFDYYMWLNDDVFLYDFALVELVECYNKLLKKDIVSLIVGATTVSEVSFEFSYGGKTDKGNVVPNGKLQECTYVNGNAVLISKEIFKVLGNLSNEYTHGIGDYDYGLRAIESGFNNFTSTRYIGICTNNEIPKWIDPKASLKERKANFKSPNGLNYSEYIVFRKKFWGLTWPLFVIKAYLRLYFPKIYNKLN